MISLDPGLTNYSSWYNSSHLLGFLFCFILHPTNLKFFLHFKMFVFKIIILYFLALKNKNTIWLLDGKNKKQSTIYCSTKYEDYIKISEILFLV